jgi:hypothetical protein
MVKDFFFRSGDLKVGAGREIWAKVGGGMLAGGRGGFVEPGGGGA